MAAAAPKEEGAPVGLEAARKRLLNTSTDLWSAEDRRVVGAMLQQRIAAERERADAGDGRDGGSLLDQLARALDYRRWHRFRVERWQDGHWRKLSGPASSGERALGLTVPLFAAVASFYSQGSYALAPRLMLLDEAFAGIDDAARAHCMGLIREFDLDFVITSEREWACYAELPGVAICQLQRREGIDAVFVSRWTWDGRAKTREADPDRRFAPGMSDAADERLGACSAATSLPRCASGCASASSAPRSTMASNASGSAGLDRRSTPRWRRLIGRPQRHSNSLADRRRSGRRRLAKFRHRRLPARRAGTARRPDRSSRHRAAAGCSAVVRRVRRLQPSRLWPACSGHRRRGAAQASRLRDAAAAAELCRRAEAVLRRLPAHGITRSQLAAEVLGDAHALDNGEAVATLVLAVWRPLAAAIKDEDADTAAEPSEGANPQSPGSTERARDIWARAGVLVNELARPALFLNLPVRGAGNHRWPSGEPAYASLRSLLRSPPAWDLAGRKVHVCENPNLLAIAADRWGTACAPMVCTDGMPGAAQRCLLSQLAEAGARLCYHGDFDWPGLRIGNHVMREHARSPGASEHKTMRPRWGRRGAWRSRSKETGRGDLGQSVGGRHAGAPGIHCRGSLGCFATAGSRRSVACSGQIMSPSAPEA